MSDLPDPSAFSVNEKPREYRVQFHVTGRLEVTVEADSKEDARAQAEKMLDDETFGLELDDIDDMRVDYVTKTPPMFRVLRNGQKMQSSRLEPGDLPREPSDYNF